MNDAAIAEAVAKLEITDVLHRYARGLDRMDMEMSLSCWHEGGTDEHAPLYSGSARGFLEWLWPVHAAMEVTRHNISNIMIEVDGDRAGSESYWTVTLRQKHEGQLYDLIGQGRYVDTFERIDGRWAIRHRQSISDWTRMEPVGLVSRGEGAPRLIKPHREGIPMARWARDKTDDSYKVMKRTFG